MSGALVIDAVVRDGDVHVTDDFYRTRRLRFAKRTGDGVLLKIRIEPADEAAKHAQFKHLFGHLLGPIAEYNGDTVDEWKNRVKALFLKDGYTSLTDQNFDEFESFNKSVAEYIRENLPDGWEQYCLPAMALSEHRSS